MAELQEESAGNGEVKEEVSVCANLGKFLILFALYFSQGLCFGFYNDALTLFLIENGAEPKDLGILSFQLYPFSFKFLLAPAIDYYSSKLFGKHKTYLVPAQYVFGIVQLVTSFRVEEYIKHKEIWYLFMAGMTSHIALGFQSVAVDSWVITLVPEKLYSMAATCKLVGIILGGFFSYNVFVLFADVTVYGVQPLRAFYFQFFIGVMAIFVGFVIHFCVTEELIESSDAGHVEAVGHRRAVDSRPSFGKTLMAFVMKRPLLILVGFLVLSPLGFAPVNIGSTFLLIPHGFSKEAMTWISTIQLPFSILFSIFIGEFLMFFNELKLILIAYGLKFVESIAFFYIYVSYQQGNIESFQRTWWSLLVGGLLSIPVASASYIASCSFHSRIADKRVSAIYIAVLNALANMGNDLGRTLTFFSLQYLEFKKLSVLGWIFAACFLLAYGKSFLDLDTVSKEEWEVTQPDEKITEVEAEPLMDPPKEIQE